VASPEPGARGAGIYMKLFVAHKTTRNNTVNKLRVDAAELPRLLSQNTTRSTGTVYTSAKARLTSVSISVPPSGESFGIFQLNNITTAAIWRISMNE